MEIPHRKLYWLIILPIVWVGLVFYLQSRTPVQFIKGTIVHIEKNTSLTSAAKILAADNIIRSPFIFRLYTILQGSGHGAAAGDYFFAGGESAWAVARRVTHGEQNLTPIRVVLPEGTTLRGMASALVKAIPTFDSKKFLEITSASSSQSEGYLFPDTYLFYQNVTPEKVVNTLHDEFEQKISAVTSSSTLLASSTLIASSTVKIKDVIIMASILEKEAKTTIDRRIVAGILWKRLRKGMLLQIDPPFGYILGKSSDELTLDDLAIDSPYNTYKYKGLPPTPIDNPGLDALVAALTPTQTKYFFYISDIKGNMHYAETYEGHLANRTQFLGK